MSPTRYTKRSGAVLDTRAHSGCDRRAEALVGFTVRSRFTGNVFVVTEASEESGCRFVRGRDCWAMLDAVTVIAPPKEVSRW